jgi:hypothetical protein
VKKKYTFRYSIDNSQYKPIEAESISKAKEELKGKHPGSKILVSALAGNNWNDRWNNELNKLS